MINQDLLAGLLLGIQVMLYNRILPFYNTYILRSDFMPKILDPVINILYIFNLIMLVASTAKVYTVIKSEDPAEKKNHQLMVVAGIIVVLLINLVAEILVSKYRVILR